MDEKIITVFRDFSDTRNPTHTTLDKVLSHIRKPSDSFVSLIDSIRKETDVKIKSSLKKKLPCILFSGKFTQRNDKSIEEHSGYAVIDFDHVTDVVALKNKLKLIPYISAAFISPSGDGVKAVARIPISIDHHRENYEAMIDDVKEKTNALDSQLDKTSINESRICYASYDKDIYINSKPKCFLPPKKNKVVYIDYNKINIAVNMIRLAQDGEKHNVLLKAAKLMGGYIASGMIEESFARQVLETEISNRDINDIRSAKKTIDDGFAYGKTMPLYESESIEYEANLDTLRVKVSNPRRKYEFLTDLQEDKNDLDRYRVGDFKMGEPTGHTTLDKHFLFKEGEYNVVLGHANVGKSFMMWWLMVVASVRLDWNWLVYSTENKVRQIKKKLIEFYTQTPISEMDDTMYNNSIAWMDEHFTFIRIDRVYSAIELLDFARLLMKEKEYKGFLIDPYNSLGTDKDLWAEFKGNRHEYDYAIGSEFVKFCDRENVSIFLNAHAHTEALRRKHSKGSRNEPPHEYAGHPAPPEASDIEGGGKFVNRVTGFFIVIHRYIYHPTDWKYTRVEIKKVKDVETGGKPTRYEEPISFELGRGMTYFYERGTGFNPIKHDTSQSSRASVSDYSFDFDNDKLTDSPF